jgi:phosphohistidine phosphatase
MFTTWWRREGSASFRSHRLTSGNLYHVKLYIMRHGPAEDESPSGRDEYRALTTSGRERVRAVARVLVELDEAPLAIFSSPLVRALQTAEIVAAVTKLGDGERGLEIHGNLAPGGHALELVKSLLHPKRKRVMLVGHEPDLSLLAGLLLGGPIPVPLDRAMVVGLSAKTGTAALRFVLDPKALALSIDLRAPH